MNDQEQDPFLKAVTSRLDRSVQDLDVDIQDRLDKLRNTALTRPLLQASVNDGDESLVAAARASLDDSIEELDATLWLRLEQHRKAALAQALESSRTAAERGSLWGRVSRLFDAGRMLVPAGAVATACLVVTVSILFYRMPGQPDPEFSEADVLMFASNDEIELYENLEFYLWLAENGLPN